MEEESEFARNVRLQKVSTDMDCSRNEVFPIRRNAMRKSVQVDRATH